jgi:trigger factor
MADEQQVETAKNVVKIKDAGPCKKKVLIEIPEEVVRKVTDERYSELGKDADVPGFRKGRAPRRLLEKRFGKEVSEQIKLQLIADATDSAIKDEKIDVLREPDVEHEEIELPESGPLKFDFEVEVRPEFELPNLEGIPVKKCKLEVTDEQVNGEIEQLRRYSGLWTPKEGAAEEGDQIIADAVLKAEDVEEEEKLDNIEIPVRANGFVGAVPVEDLDEVLTGAKSGDVKTTSVDVPKTFFREEYRGKKVDIEIKVEEVKSLKPAELDENFLGRFGVENENELRERIRDMLLSRTEQHIRTEMSGQICKYMLDKTKFDLPLEIVAEQATLLLQRQYANLMRQGLSAEQLNEQMEYLRAGSEEQAKEQLKILFIMDKVAEKLEIEVTEEEVNGYIAQMAIQRGQRPERMREAMTRDGSLSQFRMQVREDKCVAKLLESAKITEIKPEKQAKSAKKKAKKAVKKTAKKSTGKTTKKTAEKTAKTVKKKPKKSKKTAKKKTKE